MSISNQNQARHRNDTNTRSTGQLPLAENPNLVPPGRSIRSPFLPAVTPTRILRQQRSNARISASPLIVPPPLSINKDLSSHPSVPNVFGSMVNRIAPLKLDFVIVGGGIAGLACAYALGKSGHRTHVLERSTGFHQRSGGVRVPPNLTKILVEWGLQEELSRAQRCRKSALHSLDNGELVGILEWQEDVIRETGGEFLLMHYQDLYKMLYRLAISVGSKVSFESAVSSVGIDPQTESPFVVLESGVTVVADVLVGADGYSSIVREVICGGHFEGAESGHSFYTVTVPASKMKGDAALEKWAGLPEWPIWMGDSRSALGYPVRGGIEYCLHLYWPDEEVDEDDCDPGWDVVVPTSSIDLTGYAETIRRLFYLSPDALRTKFVKHETLDDWVDETGRVVVIGEAAHPLLPCTIHGPSLAVEDAAVLGVLMSRLSRVEQIPQFLEAFQDLRQERCRNVHLSELNNAMLVTMPAGDHRDMRDLAMRASLSPKEHTWGDQQLREQWDEIGEVFGYNAQDAAEDWWVKWGKLGENTRATPMQGTVEFKYEVTQVATSA